MIYQPCNSLTVVGLHSLSPDIANEGLWFKYLYWAILVSFLISLPRQRLVFIGDDRPQFVLECRLLGLVFHKEVFWRSYPFKMQPISSLPPILLAITAFPWLSIAQRAPSPGDIPLITINEVSTSGSGCPSGSVSVSISSDRTIVTLGFDEFQLGIGQGFRREDAEMNCNILLNVHYPSGYSYSVLETTYHGFAMLDEGVVGNLETEYTFADDQGRGLVGSVGGLLSGLLGGVLGSVTGLLSVVTNSVLTGGGALSDGETFTVTDTIPIREQVSAPCGGQNANLLVRTHISLEAARGGSGVLSDEDATFALTQQVHVGWERCR